MGGALVEAYDINNVLLAQKTTDAQGLAYFSGVGLCGIPPGTHVKYRITAQGYPES